MEERRDCCPVCEFIGMVVLKVAAAVLFLFAVNALITKVWGKKIKISVDIDNEDEEDEASECDDEPVNEDNEDEEAENDASIDEIKF